MRARSAGQGASTMVIDTPGRQITVFLAVRRNQSELSNLLVQRFGRIMRKEGLIEIQHGEWLVPL